MNKELYITGVFDSLKPIIRYDIAAEIDRPLNAYLDKGLQELKQRYQSANKMSRFMVWSRDRTHEFTMLWLELKPEIITSIEGYISVCKKRKMAKDIKATSARILVKNAMQEARLKHQFEGQTHRAKVSVLILPTRCLTFYITYSKLHDELPKMVESVKAIKEGLETFENKAKIEKVYNTANWE